MNYEEQILITNIKKNKYYNICKVSFNEQKNLTKK